MIVRQKEGLPKSGQENSTIECQLFQSEGAVQMVSAFYSTHLYFNKERSRKTDPWWFARRIIHFYSHEYIFDKKSTRKETGREDISIRHWNYELYEAACRNVV